MQALSVWPSKGGCGVVPPLYLEVGSSSFFGRRNRRRKKFCVVESVCDSTNADILLVSSNSRFRCSGLCFRSIKLKSKCVFLSGFSSLNLAIFCEPKKCSFGMPVMLAWAMEEQEIGNELLMVDGLSEKTESDNVDYPGVDMVENSDGNDDEESEEVDIKSEGKVREQESSRLDVRALGQSLWVAQTADDVEEVLKDVGDLPPQVYCTMIRGFGRDKKMECAIALFEWLKRKKKNTGGAIGPNLFLYNSLLGATKQSQQFREMERILKDMAEEGIAPDIVTYNSLMAIYIEQGKATKALNVLEEIQQKGFTPSAISYSQALLAYRRMEDGIGALKFFVEFRQKYLKGDVGKNDDEDWENEFAKLENFTIRICYQVMRHWLVKDENLSTNVLKLLTEMDKAGLPPGRAEYERLVWACTRDEHYVVAKELYARIRERYSEISITVCNHLIWLMGKAKKWWAALEIYEDLLDKGPKPNNMSDELIVSHFNILLSAARKRGIWRWGVRLLNKMEEKGLKPGSREWNAVLVACSKASEYSAAVQIFKRMVEKGEKPTIISYAALLSAFEKGKLYDEALRVWEHMLNVGVEPNLYTYTIMASVFSAQGKFNKVELILQEMASTGIEPTVVTYNAIVSACARNCMSSAAYEWFHRMNVQNISPNEITYEMLIEGLAKDGKPRVAFDLYLRAHNEGLNLSTKAYDAVVQSSQAYGSTIDLTVLGAQPPDKEESGN
ncbi:protein LOW PHOTOSYNTHETIC EFFICIENCY 1, chloroplastic-like [Pistacia vera]|uniref:protein LOW PHOTOSYNTHETIC EFFICIENCY 1, chloroplastic-like n=1 Tax=Pistacia vera TaxID=55513 RepID=UPI0012634443|nr:protein LOW PHOTOSYNTHETIC EFFICIENCY 1, chloroplastic-like [Pistacia vera]XP_031265093.1 protein LOW PHOTOSYNTHETIC EFFICIENCY 1, chloroplastic-like [Pistacia vera]